MSIGLFRKFKPVKLVLKSIKGVRFDTPINGRILVQFKNTDYSMGLFSPVR